MIINYTESHSSSQDLLQKYVTSLWCI